MKYLSIKTFILSFLVGMLFIFLSSPSHRSVVVYPTVDNQDKFQYKDMADNCFTFKPNVIKCPYLDNNVSVIPPQV
jgi:hypothetical protein